MAAPSRWIGGRTGRTCRASRGCSSSAPRSPATQSLLQRGRSAGTSAPAVGGSWSTFAEVVGARCPTVSRRPLTPGHFVPPTSLTLSSRWTMLRVLAPAYRFVASASPLGVASSVLTSTRSGSSPRSPPGSSSMRRLLGVRCTLWTVGCPSSLRPSSLRLAMRFRAATGVCRRAGSARWKAGLSTRCCPAGLCSSPATRWRQGMDSPPQTRASPSTCSTANRLTPLIAPGQLWSLHPSTTSSSAPKKCASYRLSGAGRLM
mmetsp:Transcript_123307/g.356315  ORF Transcript_123307/g.356315 Transcript_123307/m.356315 type:complete len:260 (+) Transcript_123307:770-1549(+)